MTNVEELEDLQDLPHVGWKPRVMRGGNSPPAGPTVNWLKELKKSAVFSCKMRGTSVDLELYGVAFKHPKTIILFNSMGTGPNRVVDPEEFSKKYILFEVIEEGDDDIRTVRPPDMADDADVEGGQQTDDGA